MISTQTKPKSITKFMKKVKAAVKDFETDMLERFEEEGDEWEDIEEGDLWEIFASYCGTGEE